MGNLWWEVALTLAEKITEAGGYFFIEQPRASRAWTLRETELFCRLECVRTLTCNLGDYHRSPHDVPVRSKPIRLLTNAPWSIAVEQVRARAITAKAAQPGSRAPSGVCTPSSPGPQNLVALPQKPLSLCMPKSSEFGA